MGSGNDLKTVKSKNYLQQETRINNHLRNCTVRKKVNYDRDVYCTMVKINERVCRNFKRI